MDFLVHSVLRAQHEHQGKYEETNGIFDDAVSQQRRGNNAGGHLRTGDLNRDEQRTEREDHERQRYSDKSPEQRLRALHRQAQKSPSEPTVKSMQ